MRGHADHRPHIRLSNTRLVFVLLEIMQTLVWLLHVIILILIITVYPSFIHLSAAAAPTSRRRQGSMLGSRSGWDETTLDPPGLSCLRIAPESMPRGIFLIFSRGKAHLSLNLTSLLEAILCTLFQREVASPIAQLFPARSEGRSTLKITLFLLFWQSYSQTVARKVQMPRGKGFHLIPLLSIQQ